jgi:hypothetical protein
VKKTIVPVLVVVLLTSGLIVGCIGGIRGVVTGSRNLETREFEFTGFTRVEVGSAFEVEIAQSDSYSVSITADDNLFDYITVSKSGETLKIRLKWGYNYISTTQRARITMPDLYGLELSGATRGNVQGFSSSHDFILDLSGASRLTGDITAGNADIDISGASTVQLEGSASDIVVDASGASRVKLADFVVNNADVRLSGASSGTVNLDGRLDANLSGASTLNYSGNPTLGSIKTSGGSTLSEK